MTDNTEREREREGERKKETPIDMNHSSLVLELPLQVCKDISRYTHRVTHPDNSYDHLHAGTNLPIVLDTYSYGKKKLEYSIFILFEKIF